MHYIVGKGPLPDTEWGIRISGNSRGICSKLFLDSLSFQVGNNFGSLSFWVVTSNFASHGTDARELTMKRGIRFKLQHLQPVKCKSGKRQS